MKSIIENQEGCYLCGKGWNTEEHHVFGGSNRDHSETYGLKVNLCPKCHRGTEGVHGKNGHNLNIKLKQQFQRIFEKKYSRELFMKVFGKNYL